MTRQNKTTMAKIHRKKGKNDKKKKSFAYRMSRGLLAGGSCSRLSSSTFHSCRPRGSTARWCRTAKTRSPSSALAREKDH
jgi:hypothetical protein